MRARPSCQQDLAGLGDFDDALTGPVDGGAVIGMDVADKITETRLDLVSRRLIFDRELENPQCPTEVVR